MEPLNSTKRFFMVKYIRVLWGKGGEGGFGEPKVVILCHCKIGLNKAFWSYYEHIELLFSCKFDSWWQFFVPGAHRILASFLGISARRRFQADGEGHGHIIQRRTQCTHFHVMMSPFCRAFLTRSFPDVGGLIWKFVDKIHCIECNSVHRGRRWANDCRCLDQLKK